MTKGKQGKIAVIRVRGVRNMEPKIKASLNHLKLFRPNHCVLLEDDGYTAGALKVVKDYVAYGIIDEETLFKLLHKRGEKGSKFLREVLSEEQLKNAAKEILGGKALSEFADPVLRLHAPRSGYKDIKKQYPRGDLGRHSDINELIKRMM